MCKSENDVVLRKRFGTFVVSPRKSNRRKLCRSPDQTGMHTHNSQSSGSVRMLRPATSVKVVPSNEDGTITYPHCREERYVEVVVALLAFPEPKKHVYQKCLHGRQ
jgi:hypothetical protein